MEEKTIEDRFNYVILISLIFCIITSKGDNLTNPAIIRLYYSYFLLDYNSHFIPKTDNNQ